MTTDTKASFILYSEYSELINELPDEDAGALIKAVFEYVNNGTSPAKLNGPAKIVFITIRQSLDRNALKYEEKRQKLQENGRKGGRPKKNSALDKNETEEIQSQKILTENQMVFSESKKSLHVNVNDNANVNVNVNENENENVSLSDEREKNYARKNKTKVESVTKKEREILENYVRRNKLATKTIRAYVNKIIENGDHKEILEKEKERLRPRETREERIKKELASIVDRRSCARVLYRYHLMGTSPPDEFDDVADKYNLDTYDKLYQYGRELEAAESG